MKTTIPMKCQWSRWLVLLEFGYGPLDLLLYRDPGLPFVGGLKPLVYDNDVVKMVEIIRGHHEIELYVTFLEDVGHKDTNDRKGGERAEVDNGAIKEYDSDWEWGSNTNRKHKREGNIWRNINKWQEAING